MNRKSKILADRIENHDVEYYFQASMIYSGVCDCRVGDLYSEIDKIPVQMWCLINYLHEQFIILTEYYQEDAYNESNIEQ